MCENTISGVVLAREYITDTICQCNFPLSKASGIFHSSALIICFCKMHLAVPYWERNGCLAMKATAPNQCVRHLDRNVDAVKKISTAFVCIKDDVGGKWHMHNPMCGCVVINTMSKIGLWLNIESSIIYEIDFEHSSIIQMLSSSCP